MLWITAVTDTIGKMITGDWTIAAIVIGIILFDGVDHRPTDLHGFIEGLSLYTVSTVMTRTAFNHRDLGIWDQFQEIAGLRPKILNSLVA